MLNTHAACCRRDSLFLLMRAISGYLALSLGPLHFNMWLKIDSEPTPSGHSRTTVLRFFEAVIKCLRDGLIHVYEGAQYVFIYLFFNHLSVGS